MAVVASEQYSASDTRYGEFSGQFLHKPVSSVSELV
jgi:hypothetical protein